MNLIPILITVLAFESSYAQSVSCGVRKVTVQRFVARGNATRPGDFPWHAAIFHNSNRQFEYKCGGTLINQNTIVTAAHCVFDINGQKIIAERFSVQLGKHRIKTTEANSQEHEVFRVISHENYDNINLQNDIALLKLSTDVTFTDYIQPACIWSDTQTADILTMRGTAVGWGMNETFQLADELIQAQLPVVTNFECLQSNPVAFRNHLSEKVYCAGDRTGTNVCNGDSGGGMVFLINNAWYLRGIVSLGTTTNSGFCDPNEYAVFTDVKAFMVWITSNSAIVVNPGIVDHANYNLLNDNNCGPDFHVQPFPERKKPLFGQYPWLALLEFQSTSGIGPLCVGTLINTRYVVTVAHCVEKSNVRTLVSVRLGDYDLTTDSDCEQDFCAVTQSVGIESTITHPQFNKPRFSHDIALIRLVELADVARDNIKPICMPITDDLRNKKLNTFILTGWSKTGLKSNILKRHVPTMSDPILCQSQYTTLKIPLDKTCAQVCIQNDKTQRVGSCEHLMSGSPIQSVESFNSQPKYIYYGFLSFGPKKCQESYPDVYISIVSYMKWILDNIKA